MIHLAISIKDAGHALGIGRSSIYKLIAEGKLAKIKLGRRSLIPTESIRALIERA